jgi:hypothetical protein
VKITHLQITNYKGFRDSGRIVIGRKFTILVGQNNAGKTAFLETLSTTTLNNNPFKEPDPAPGGFPPVHNPQSSIIFNVHASGEELKWWLLNNNLDVTFCVVTNNHENALVRANQFFSAPDIQVAVKFIPRVWSPVESPSVPLSPAPDHNVVVGPTPTDKTFKSSNCPLASLRTPSKF